MEQLLIARTPRIAGSSDDEARARSERKRRSKPVALPLLVLHIVGVAVLVAASVAAIADQSARFVSGQEIVGVHEIPAFIADRVELPPGATVENSVPAEVAPSTGAARTELAARDGGVASRRQN